MFAHIRGTLAAIDANTAIIDVNGVGFKLGMSTLSLAALGPLGSEVTAYTRLIVRDDALDLYGFIEPSERELFERLLSVTGVGPKAALSALSSFAAQTLQQLIIDEDVKRLTTIPGLGKKTAQRLILELRGVLVANEEKTVLDPAADGKPVSRQVADALQGMGFTRSEIELASQGYDGPPDDVAARVRHALKRLGGAK
jgi:Holliday junction DNA helicase RuvA